MDKTRPPIVQKYVLMIGPFAAYINILINFVFPEIGFQILGRNQDTLTTISFLLVMICSIYCVVWINLHKNLFKGKHWHWSAFLLVFHLVAIPIYLWNKTWIT